MVQFEIQLEAGWLLAVWAMARAVTDQDSAVRALLAEKGSKAFRTTGMNRFFSDDDQQDDDYHHRD